MRPIKLEIQGLNSYISKQTIDFTKLTERGLFGIFGKTGSGKSTILDAMTLSLYGNISRNTKEYINSMSECAKIRYEFEIGGRGNERYYIVDRTIERTKTGIKTPYARIIEKKADSEDVLAEKVQDVNSRIISIIGLTAEDFTKSVVLPQDKFNDFLKLGGVERRNMLERIFGLEKYGKLLTEKVRKRKSNRNIELEKLKTSVEMYEGKTREAFENMRKESEDIKENIRDEKRSLNEKTEKYEQGKELFENIRLLSECEKRLGEYEERKDDIESKRKWLERAINANSILPQIEASEKLSETVEKTSSEIKEIDRELQIEKKELDVIKIRYNEAYSKKEERIPRLSREKIKYEDAIVYENEALNLEKEIKNIKNRIDELEVIKSEEERNISNENLSLLKSEKRLKEIDDELSRIRVSAAYRQDVENGSEMEKELKRIKSEYEKLQYDIEKEQITYDDKRYRLAVSEKSMKDNEEKRNNINSAIIKLEDKKPVSNAEISSKAVYISELSSEIKRISELENKKDSIMLELSENSEKMHKIKREISECNDKISKAERDIQTFEKNIDEMKYRNRVSEIRKELEEGKPCPVCGSIHHMRSDSESYDDRIQYYEENLEKVKIEKLQLSEKLEELNSDYGGYKSMHTIKTVELEQVKSSIGEKNSRELINKHDNEKRLLERARVYSEEWEKEKRRLEEEYRKANDEYTKSEKEYTAYKIECEHKNDSLKRNRESLKDISQNIEKLNENIKSIKLKLKLNNISSRLEEIRANDLIEENLENSRKEVVSERDKSREYIEIYRKKINEIDPEIYSGKESIKEKTSILKQKRDSIYAISSGKNLKEMLDKTEKAIEDINREYSEYKEKYESKKEKTDELEKIKNKLKGENISSEKRLIDQKKIIEKLLHQNRFDSVYTVKKSAADTETIQNIQSEISEYDEGRKHLDIKVEELKKLTDGKKINKSEFINLQDEIAILKRDISEKEKESAVIQDRLYTLKNDVEKAEEIREKYKKASKEFEILEEIDRTVRGNRFVEYAAASHLKYIALEASQRLSSITNGRYALEINDSMEFVIRDNFNGGERRGIDTLSGGETFMTSLSLALALSSQIQMKGNSPLEFFFLDEGFGSLDTELLDTVMESLEKLHKNDLSIGIISHVEELKSRVPVKLVVTSGDIGEGSKVNIEYS
ncbi:nuclease SbcCD subunit C [Peptacetobacter hominis]|uniref:Nuclease SbcCD subunit C n=1 Tax=Peptacetobacter hominis TaxID=2743610 RepID=A0A544QTR9_9FIRM|nr:SbcC/MukB-like Walker B domain-containing protein [Peptacetobacter hominis]TQQ84088.1 nuclease SbcCD subunit C [Peptacetobacter hominis]